MNDVEKIQLATANPDKPAQSDGIIAMQGFLILLLGLIVAIGLVHLCCM